MAKEKKFRDGKKKRRGVLAKGQKSPSESSNETKISKKQKRKKLAKNILKRFLGFPGGWTLEDEAAYLRWNRAQTSGVSIQDLTENTAVLEEASFVLEEISLDVDVKAAALRKKRKQGTDISNVLKRANIK